MPDACTNEETIGGCLMQNDGNGDRPVAYYSRKLTEAELWCPATLADPVVELAPIVLKVMLHSAIDP